MLLSIVGQGFVGGSLATVLSERNIEVYAYDISGKCAPGAKKLDEAKDLESFVKELEKKQEFSGIYFVCLPTPMKEDGSCDVSIVEGVLDQLSVSINSNDFLRTAVVKSTIPPGTTKRWNEKYRSSNLRVVFNPEFLTEANALQDMRNQDRIILGGEEQAVFAVEKIFKFAFPDVPIYKTTSSNAEMVKYVGNCFLATKVSFANEIYQLCNSLKKEVEIDYNQIIELAKLDKRLGNSHWQVPGPMPSDDTKEFVFGYGGSCFVKDVNALIHVMKNSGVDPKVLEACWNKNLEVRPQRDWEKLSGRAVIKKE